MNDKRGKTVPDGRDPAERTRRVALVTLGCKVNQCDSAGMAQRLEQLGHTLVGFDAEADVFIVNTCTVTARTDFQSRQLIRRAARRNPSAPVIVTGCYAQVAPELLKALPNVRLVAGNVEKELIPGLVGSLNGGPAEVRVRNIGQTGVFSGLTADRFPGRTRAFLKIQDGCNARCSYCIVPTARGPSRSMPPGDVLERVAALAGSGCREIVLTGVHLGAWGADLSPASGLPQLLRRIEEAGTVGRLRLSSIEPLEVSGELIACLRESAVLCPHVHIPLQSGDDTVLTAMGRHYDRRFFRDLVHRLADEIPGVAVGVDVMAGFPGEGDREFENTLELLRGLPAAYFHVFPYSERPGTKAAALPGKVEETLRARRAAELRALGLAKREAFAKRAVGSRQTVLVEGSRDRKTGRLKGFTGNYIPVLLAGGGRDSMNRLIDVVIESAEAGTASARVCHEQ
ncbi:MAG: tRNA (N(6)-L-threonylcarbamoyladenosine(37)-C(2))-methylthiotransferase MtaB [Syntrophales bacterium]|nr:tRNA (N(6)-L-threonylcarbamoyladenosine(37)-C(2))-methylthiotransferase MtaB [Syntrophales bacterium]MCU0582862.1 tRNA (N(6)-L-threonylcarbamoyladenosine(37)-C(2))-methylthiotransferase MtaB [Syntrophales bacterium]